VLRESIIGAYLGMGFKTFVREELATDQQNPAIEQLAARLVDDPDFMDTDDVLEMAHYLAPRLNDDDTLSWMKLVGLWAFLKRPSDAQSPKFMNEMNEIVRIQDANPQWPRKGSARGTSKAPAASKKVSLELTPREFRKAIEMVFLGEYLVNMTHEVDRGYDEEAEELLDVLMRRGVSVSTVLGNADPVKHASEWDRRFQRSVLLHAAELVAVPLAKRDLTQIAKERDLVQEEANDWLEQRVTFYVQHFMKHGFDHLVFTGRGAIQ